MSRCVRVCLHLQENKTVCIDLPTDATLGDLEAQVVKNFGNIRGLPYQMRLGGVLLTSNGHLAMLLEQYVATRDAPKITWNSMELGTSSLPPRLITITDAMVEDISFSQPFADTEKLWEYRYVVLPRSISSILWSRVAPRGTKVSNGGWLPSEVQWRSLGITQSRGWAIVGFFGRNQLAFRRLFCAGSK